MDQHKHSFIEYPNGQKPTSCMRCGLTPQHQVHDVVPTEVGRISRPMMYFAMLEVIRKRSTCLRAKVAALIVRDGRVVSMGYNGAPPGTPHCTTETCVEGHTTTIHAEANAIAWAARAGIATEGATMYSTHSPCIDCAKLIISCGITSFMFLEDYREGRIDVLEEAGLETKKY